MPEYTQEGRPMRVDTVLETDELLLQSFSGVEGISTPYSYRVRLVSENDSIAATDLLRTGLTLSVELEDGEIRHIHGIVSRFAQGDQADDLTSYEAEIVPSLWFLSLSKDCKIFQEKSVLEIVEEVFGEQGVTDFDIRCTTSYPTREYVVQYRETHLQFVSRLLEEEGIFYFFEHSGSGHVLVLADDNSAIQPCPSKPVAAIRSEEVPEEDVVTGLRTEHAVHVGTVSLQDYDFEQPSMNLLSTMSGEEQQEIYDYHPQRYRELEEGERYARLQLEVLEASRQVVYGDGNCRAFTSGCRFELEDHFSPDLNQPYTLVQVSHNARSGDYRSQSDTDMDYRNGFLAIPHDVPFRPQPVHARPVIQGSQTAIVVGPSGEEVYTDKYGRVKVQFYWDRLGQKNEHSSCWIRVATPWGGKGYGGVSIPRIGNEVIVDFLEGDPDRPLIVGSVYNADQTPPFELPGAGIQMGMKSRSSPGGGGHNEITMTDTAGEEVMTVHAQRDRNVTVLGDETIHIYGNQVVTIDGKGSGGANAETKGSATSVTGDYKIDASSKVEIQAPTHILLTCGGSSIKLEPGKITITAGGSASITLDGNAQMKSAAGSEVFLDGNAFTKSSGGSKLLLDGNANLTANSGGQVLLDGNALLAGAAVNVEATGIAQIKGAQVKNN